MLNHILWAVLCAIVLVSFDEELAYVRLAYLVLLVGQVRNPVLDWLVDSDSNRLVQIDNELCQYILV